MNPGAMCCGSSGGATLVVAAEARGCVRVRSARKPGNCDLTEPPGLMNIRLLRSLVPRQRLQKIGVLLRQFVHHDLLCIHLITRIRQLAGAGFDLQRANDPVRLVQLVKFDPFLAGHMHDLV